MIDNYKKNNYVVIREFIPYDLMIFYREYLDTLRTNGVFSSPFYGDPCYDTLMLYCLQAVSFCVDTKLVPLYTEAKAYSNNADILPQKHPEYCEHTVSLFLGGVYEKTWPLWVSNLDSPEAPALLALNPGDAVIYRGNKLHHWRDNFEGISHYQLEMHYAEAEGKYLDKRYDGRDYIGLPKNDEH